MTKLEGEWEPIKTLYVVLLCKILVDVGVDGRSLYLYIASDPDEMSQGVFLQVEGERENGKVYLKLLPRFA